MLSSKRLHCCCMYPVPSALAVLSTTTIHSTLDTATLIMAVDALFEKTVDNVGKTWIPLRLPRYGFTLYFALSCL